MKFTLHIATILLQIWAVYSATAKEQWPLHSDGLISDVEWDHYSYIIKGQRLFIWSGEMHYWRAPVPDIWIDILQKVKAAGFNTVSFYANWGYHSAKSSTLDFENGAHNFTTLFEIAKEVGLYVLFRPGPYINAEATAGGFPGWLTTGEYGTLRNNDTRYTDSWTPYFTRMSQIISEHQISNGGNVFIYQIENEYGEQFIDADTKTPNYTAIAYMELLEQTARSSGVNIPFIANNPNMNSKSWSQDYSSEGGNVDIYGLDSYPSCWSCNLTECVGTNGAVADFTLFDYFTNFQQVAPTQPSFLAEFQGGSYNPWGGPQGGCTSNTGPDWVNVYYRHNIAEKVSAMNVYMAFGGTSGLPMPTVATSYDYSAPISESRVISDKYYETKLFGQFLRVARGLTKVDLIANGTGYASTPLVYTTELRNPDTNGAFYVTVQTSSPSTNRTGFKLDVSTSLGNLTIPKYAQDIVLDGRQSKIIVTDFPIGPAKLIYSTAEILTLSTLEDRTVLFLWVPTGESGEFLLAGSNSGVISKCTNCSDVLFNATKEGLITSFTQSSGTSIFEYDNGIQVVVMDRSAAYYTWMPSLTNDPYSPDNSTVVVQGPCLVRDVSVENSCIYVTGDWSDESEIEIFAPWSVTSVSVNSQKLETSKTSYGSITGKLRAPDHSIESLTTILPALDTWRVNDGMPERDPKYDDSKWTVANHSTTSNPSPPATYPVLYADEYGYHTGNILWRGRFFGSTVEGVYLNIIGGTSSGWSAFLNGDFIGSWLGTTAVTSGALTLSFANATLNTDSDNVLFVIQDHMGKDETTGTLNPRGILNATLIGGTNSTSNFTSWVVTGNAGGEDNIDPVRGPYNEGGLHAERLGWHLPGFNDSTWQQSTPNSGIEEAGARFYRTVVPLDIPLGYDVSLGLGLYAPAGSKFRAQLYVNGYMFGKFVPHIGNQVVFPVFPGILDYHGNNTIAISVWAQSTEGAIVTISWEVLGVVESSFDPGFAAGYLRPGWSKRSQFS